MPTEISTAASRSIFQSIFDGIPDGILVINRSFKVIIVNKTMQAYLGKAVAEVVGKHCYFICQNRKEICNDCQAQNAFMKIKPPSRIRACGSGNFEGQFEIWNYPIANESGDVYYIIEYMKDITKRQAMERELIHARHLAIIGEMAAKTSHEIRNPLNAMEGAAHYLLGEYKNDTKIQKYLGLIKDQILRLNDVTTELLKIAKPRIALDEKALINKVILKSIEIVEYDARDKRIDIELFLNESLPEICFDETSMQEVFLNILKNACDAIDSKGTIEIVGQPRERGGEQFIEIAVTDNGHGIPNDAKDKLFDSFYTTKEHGTGLGLSIVKDIMKSHGGYVFMESEPGSGTTVVLGLPVE